MSTWPQTRHLVLEVIKDHQALLDRVTIELSRSSNAVSYAKLARLVVELVDSNKNIISYLQVLTPVSQFVNEIQEKYHPASKNDSLEYILQLLIKVLHHD